MALYIKAALGYDTEERVKLEAGIELTITKFTIHEGKTFKTARIDAIVDGKEMLYYSAGKAIVGALEQLQKLGIDEPITAKTVLKKSEINGYSYICFQ